MADDTPAPPVAAAADQVPQPAAVAAPAPAPAPAAEPPAPAVPQGLLDRIDRLTRDKRELEEANRRLQAQTTVAAPAPAAAPAVAAPPAPVFDASEIDRRARELADQRIFTDKCNAIASAGAAKHQDFQGVVQQLGAMGALDPSIINAAIEIGEPSELLYALGKDLNEAARIAALGPEQKAVALMKFAQKRAEVAAALVSSAPAPTSATVGGAPAAPSGEPSPEDDADSWFAKREKQTGRYSGNYGP